MVICRSRDVSCLGNITNSVPICLPGWSGPSETQCNCDFGGSSSLGTVWGPVLNPLYIEQLRKVEVVAMDHKFIRLEMFYKDDTSLAKGRTRPSTPRNSRSISNIRGVEIGTVGFLSASHACSSSMLEQVVSNKSELINMEDVRPGLISPKLCHFKSAKGRRRVRSHHNYLTPHSSISFGDRSRGDEYLSKRCLPR